MALPAAEMPVFDEKLLTEVRGNVSEETVAYVLKIWEGSDTV